MDGNDLWVANPHVHLLTSKEKRENFLGGNDLAAALVRPGGEAKRTAFFVRSK
jgi:hypothetical protein